VSSLAKVVEILQFHPCQASRFEKRYSASYEQSRHYVPVRYPAKTIGVVLCANQHSPKELVIYFEESCYNG